MINSIKHESFISNYLDTFATVLKTLSDKHANAIVKGLIELRNHGGRLAVMGMGGSAANASHFTNDLRKIAKIDAYCPTDNVSELTARINDEGVNTVFVDWMRTGKWCPLDAIFILSVGGGSASPPVSVNLIQALDYAKSLHCKVYGIVGRPFGYTAMHADAAVILPDCAPDWQTPFAESLQSVVCHGLVSHPSLKLNPTKW